MSQNKKNIYLVGGLASVGSVFEYLSVLNGHNVCFIKWIEPKKNETFQDYSIRLAEKITTKHNNIFIGVSFGGLVLQEIKRVYPELVDKLIIISSIKNHREKPFIIKMALSLRLHLILKIIPSFLLNVESIFFFTNIKMKGKYKNLIKKYFDKSLSVDYIRWGIKKIMTYRPPVDDDIYHIHGTKDEIFPCDKIVKTPRTFFVKDGNHAMIIPKNKIINELIENIIYENN